MHFMALLGPLAFAELLRTVKADCLGDCPEGHHLIKIQPVIITYPEKGLASNTAFTSTESLPCEDEYITTTIPGPFPTTYTIPPTGTNPGSVVIETPTWTTITTPGSVLTTETIPPKGTTPGTVIIHTPTSEPPTSAPPETWITRTTPGSIWTTESIPPKGTTPGMVIIHTPTSEPPTSSEPPESWITRTTPGSILTTETIPPKGTTPGSVIIHTPTSEAPTSSEPPESWVTRTTPGSILTTESVPPEGTTPGTVIIHTPTSEPPTSEPPESWVTRTTPGSVLTTESIPPEGTTPGTVIIHTPTSSPRLPITTPVTFSNSSKAPPPTITTTTTDSIITTETIPGAGTTPGSVIIHTSVPESWITITSPGPEDFTTTVATPDGTTPGTVVIETPSWTTYTTEGTVATTKSIPPEGTNPGTVVIETTPPAIPESWVTITSPGPEDLTTTVATPEGTTPGTVIIETSSWTTYTTEGTVATTKTIPPEGTNPGTVVIETTPPGIPETTSPAVPETTSPAVPETTSPAIPESWVTITSPGPEDLTTTVATPEGTTPGTVIIETSSWTTYTTEGNIATTKTIPPEGTNPGTVIIETPAPTLECDRYGYLIQAAYLYRVNIETGATEPVGTELIPGASINALGYNALDNYLYGLDNNNHNIVRISNNGTAQNVVGVTVQSVVGDIDNEGCYWVLDSAYKYYKFDLKPGSSTYGTVLDQGQTTNSDKVPRLLDWVYLPNHGRQLWSIFPVPNAGEIRMVRFDMTTHAFFVVRTWKSDLDHSFGAAWGQNPSTVYISDNSNGEIWAYDVTNASRRKVSVGPVSSINDGARCVANVNAET
ncbi:uncharacterized protein E0L32_002363 [Thyridium curvatum]|uniref:DUF6923 domain-containing protein n=1 Tax=Thyridium curvatum TaxID=1093900 RepID=A0A507AJA9_9PEZI|nr:uncharacterized protein E0L32_002363 [Thyridium curvatum]TPX06867.1 hypothetical protein E0L32_002363 [Thyridium curvatum]